MLLLLFFPDNVNAKEFQVRHYDSCVVAVVVGNVSEGGIQVRYRDSCGEQQSVTLETADVMLQKVNTQWTNALHRVSTAVPC